MNQESFMIQPVMANIPRSEDVTEKILGVSENSNLNLRQEDYMKDRSYRRLHLPPFWWEVCSQSSKPWECWSMEDYNYRKCNWEGCFRPCSCQQKEIEPSNCRYPNFCGYHVKHSVPNLKNEKKSCSAVQVSTKKDTCYFCRMKRNALNGTGRKIPDPRCVGQYHLPLLEKVLGRGTALAISETEEGNPEDDDCERGYIPGDIYGYRSWSGKVGRDPMCEEFNNGIFPKEICPYDMGLSHVAETHGWRNVDASIMILGILVKV
ncbi:hypothetical protein J437_LFUL013184 [Ladona fulva]|uniref:Uncharacterized protein n=1 Tax=Ladona fulva TaxID=123851 RepID=A0A8K0KB36_LADFU|nr:hypothetical protein J437_LFUL013184 [Ladona fulva]